ncbi:8874_t:CDS:1 [Funneliformis geosporum]|uniref:3693_t:CDS:1 n=1 Tax=Funneliformis geosporum TaxID=1117311 RepID=A0A9W4SIY8_9GLOM|nr:3693_t:CDS:1 [Funneliformis geosporum]CAI2176417.1 8874_t:CDS:1 [Funneliformis geosporum]
MKIFHRDVRPSNILLDASDNTLVLADWGSAISNPSNKLVPYEGTITFASPEILNNDMRPYQPKESDDLHSFIRTMYVLHNQTKLPIIPDGTFESKAQAIRGFWNDSVDVKMGGLVWKEMVNAAKMKIMKFWKDVVISLRYNANAFGHMDLYFINI